MCHVLICNCEVNTSSSSLSMFCSDSPSRSICFVVSGHVVPRHVAKGEGELSTGRGGLAGACDLTCILLFVLVLSHTPIRRQIEIFASLDTHLDSLIIQLHASPFDLVFGAICPHSPPLSTTNSFHLLIGLLTSRISRVADGCLAHPHSRTFGRTSQSGRRSLLRAWSRL